MLVSFLQSIVALPLMYILALPLDKDPGHQKDAAQGVVDVDILVRFWRFCTREEDRRDSWQRCRRHVMAISLVLARSLPLLGAVAYRVGSEEFRRALRDGQGRAV